MAGWAMSACAGTASSAARVAPARARSQMRGRARGGTRAPGASPSVLGVERLRPWHRSVLCRSTAPEGGPPPGEGEDGGGSRETGVAPAEPASASRLVPQRDGGDGGVKQPAPPRRKGGEFAGFLTAEQRAEEDRKAMDMKPLPEDEKTREERLRARERALEKSKMEKSLEDKREAVKKGEFGGFLDGLGSPGESDSSEKSVEKEDAKKEAPGTEDKELEAVAKRLQEALESPRDRKRLFTQLGPSGQETEGMDVRPLVELFTTEARDVLRKLSVDQDDIELIKDRLCGLETFWCTGQEQHGAFGESVRLRGNMRGKDPAAVFRKMTEGMLELGLDSKYKLYMVSDESRTSEGVGVSLLVVPNAVAEPELRGGDLMEDRKGDARTQPLIGGNGEGGQPSLGQVALAFLLFGATGLCALEVGLFAEVSRLPPEVLEILSDPNGDPNMLPPDFDAGALVAAAVPTAIALLGPIVAHEAARLAVAAQRGVTLGVPYFIPNLQIGSFGAVTRVLSVVRSREDQFDLAASGPAVGATLAACVFGTGLLFTQNGVDVDAFVDVPTQLFQGSFLLGTLARTAMGDVFGGADVAVHPLVVAGWCGLVVNALQLLPVGAVDGGKMVQAQYGRGPARLTGLVTYACLALGVIASSISVLFALYAIILQRGVEQPALDDVTVPKGMRPVSLGLAVGFAFLTLAPMWTELAEALHVGPIRMF